MKVADAARPHGAQCRLAAGALPTTTTAPRSSAYTRKLISVASRRPRAIRRNHTYSAGLHVRAIHHAPQRACGPARRRPRRRAEQRPPRHARARRRSRPWCGFAVVMVCVPSSPPSSPRIRSSVCQQVSRRSATPAGLVGAPKSRLLRRGLDASTAPPLRPQGRLEPCSRPIRRGSRRASREAPTPCHSVAPFQLADGLRHRRRYRPRRRRDRRRPRKAKGRTSCLPGSTVEDRSPSAGIREIGALPQR